MTNLSVIIFLFLASSILAAKLPSSFKKCSKNQGDLEQCLVRAANDWVKSNTTFKEIGVEEREPITSISEKFSKSGFFYNIEGTCKILDFHVNDVTFTHFKINFQWKKIDIGLSFSNVSFQFYSDYNGTLMTVPVWGNLTGNKLIENSEIDLKLRFKEIYSGSSSKNYKLSSSRGSVRHYNNAVKKDLPIHGYEKTADYANDITSYDWDQFYKVARGDCIDSHGPLLDYNLRSLLFYAPLFELFDQ